MFGLTRQAYYKQKLSRLEKTFEESIVIELVSEIKRNHRYMGVRKIYELLQPQMLEHGIKMGRDALYDLLWINGMLIRKRRRKTTTNSNHKRPIYENIIYGKQANAPNEIWVSDITYIPVNKGFVYLSLVTDAYSRKIVGYSVSRKLDSNGPSAALEMAIRSLEGKRELIHHSDRGIQYCSKEYTNLLIKAGITISMSRAGTPIDNAIAERVNGIIKNEYLKGKVLDSFETATETIIRSIHLYNTERPHMSCGMLTPEEAHKGEMELTKLWKKM